MGSILTSFYKEHKEFDDDPKSGYEADTEAKEEEEGNNKTPKLRSSKTSVSYKAPYYKKRKDKKKNI